MSLAKTSPRDIQRAPSSSDTAPAKLDKAPSSGSNHAQDLWKSGSKKVRASVSMSRAFHTLRSMHEDSLVPASALQHVKRLGEGAFAYVDLCWYSNGTGGPKVLVAVKHLKPHVFSEPADLDAFFKEAVIIQRISHPNIVGCMGVGEMQVKEEDASGVYVLQEYMAAGTLKNMVFKKQLGGKRVYSQGDALRWSIHIAKALSYLHSAKPMIIHRDLKLENILLTGPSTSTMTAKVADFGLCASVDTWMARKQAEGSIRGGTANASRAAPQTPGSLQAAPVTPPPTSALAATGLQPPSSQQVPADATAGATVPQPSPLRSAWTSLATNLAVRPPATPHTEVYRLSGHTGSLMYMAPEVYLAQPYNHKVDVFSFSLLMLEIFTGHVLSTSMAPNGFTSEVEAFCHKMANEGFRPPIPPYVPPSIAALVRECWAADPKQRPNMDEVVKRLKAIEGSGEMAAEGAASGGQPGGCSCFG